MSTKYEVSMSNPVAREVCTYAYDVDPRRIKHDCTGSLVDKPNEPTRNYNMYMVKVFLQSGRHLADDISSKITFDENLAICLSLRFRLSITIGLS